MSGPQNAQEALSWIKEAVRENRFFPTRHVVERGVLRGASLIDVVAAIGRAASLEPYGATPEHGGTCWRVHGKDADGRRLAIGVEAYLDEDHRWVVLITVINMTRRSL